MDGFKNSCANVSSFLRNSKDLRNKLLEPHRGLMIGPQSGMEI